MKNKYAIISRIRFLVEITHRRNRHSIFRLSFLLLLYNNIYTLATIFTMHESMSYFMLEIPY